MLNYISRNMSNSKLQVTLLADEWKSSKGGLSTINRELAIQLAKHPNVSVTFFVPKCTEDDKNASSGCNVRIVKARERHAFDPLDWLSFPPDDLSIDIIIGHGVKLGKQAQIIRESHRCKWVQVVHAAPEELSMLKTYSDCDNAISKGDKKQWNEIKLCQIADLVVSVGPRLWEFYSRYLSSSGKHVFNLTPGIFSELSLLKLSTVKGKRFNVLLFGRGDSEDFKLKGFDIAAKAVAQLNDTSYKLVFVGAPSGNEEQVAEQLLEYGLSKKQLIVKSFLENRGDLATLLSTADLAVIPSRSEGFGLTALEALSAGLPFLVTQASGFGEALQDALPQSIPWVVDSEEPEKWAEAIKSVREKGREAVIAECQTLRESYGKKYIWESQCRDLVEKMVSLANASGSKMESSVTAAPSQSLNEASTVYRSDEQSTKTHPEVKNTQLKEDSGLSLSARSPLPEVLYQRLTEQRLEDKREGRREGLTAHDFETTSGRKSSYFCNQGITLEKNLSSSLERLKASGSKMKTSVTAAPSQSLNEAPIVISEIEEKQSVASSKSEQCQKLQENRPEHFVGVNEDLAILSCNASPETMADLKEILEKNICSLRLSEDPTFENLEPDKVEQFLKENLLRVCVLVIDASTLKDGFGKGKLEEYQRCFETALRRVAVKVIILVCSLETTNLSPTQKGAVDQFIGRFKSYEEKVSIVELNKGKLSVNIDDLIKILRQLFEPNTQMNRPRGSQEPDIRANSLTVHTHQFGERTNLPAEETIVEMGPPNIPQLPSQSSVVSRSILVLRGIFRRGKLSDELGDIHIRNLGIKIPDWIFEDLSKKFSYTPEIGVRIIRHHNGSFQWTTDKNLRRFSLKKEVQLFQDEVLILKTRVRNGEVSFEENDVQFLRGDIYIPPHIIARLKTESRGNPYGDLYVILDSVGQFRSVVKSGVMDRMADFFFAQK